MKEADKLANFMHRNYPEFTKGKNPIDAAIEMLTPGPSLCPHCNCMTHNVCGKCKKVK